MYQVILDESEVHFQFNPFAFGYQEDPIFNQARFADPNFEKKPKTDPDTTTGFMSASRSNSQPSFFKKKSQNKFNIILILLLNDNCGQ